MNREAPKDSLINDYESEPINNFPEDNNLDKEFMPKSTNQGNEIPFNLSSEIVGTLKEFVTLKNYEHYVSNLARYMRDKEIKYIDAKNVLIHHVKILLHDSEYTADDKLEYTTEMEKEIEKAYFEDKSTYKEAQLIEDILKDLPDEIEAKIIAERFTDAIGQVRLKIVGDVQIEQVLDEVIDKGKRPMDLIGEYLQDKYCIIKHEETEIPYILQDKGGYKELTRVFLHIILSTEWPNKFSVTHGETIAGYFSNYKQPEDNIVQFQNCYLNMETLEQIPLSEKLFTQRIIDNRYNPDAPETRLKDELKVMLGNDYDTFLQMIGYTFTTHHRDEKIFFLIGERGTGKSTLGKIIRNIIGVFNVSNVPLQNIAKNDFLSANMIGKSLNIVDDTNLGTIREPALLNSIASGSPMTFNPKYKQTMQVTGNSLPKLLIMGNSLPFIDDESRAIYERVVLMQTHKKFRGTDEVNTDFINTLKAEDYEWLIKEAIHKYKEISWPDDAEKIEKAYQLEADPYAIILDNLYEITYRVDEDQIKQSELLEDLNNTIEEYKRDNRIIRKPPLSVRKLNQLLEGRGVQKTRKTVLEDDGDDDIGRKVFFYLGIRKNPNGQQKLDEILGYRDKS